MLTLGQTITIKEKLKDEFDEYMENLSDEDYEKLFGHDRNS